VWLFSDYNFWINFWANALSDVIFSIALAFILSKLIASRNTVKLSVMAHDDSGRPNVSSLDYWPPPENSRSQAIFQFVLRNDGSVAAINWLLVIEFPQYGWYQTRERLIEMTVLSNSNFTPSVDVDNEKERWAAKYQYASATDIIHSGYRDFSPSNMSLMVDFYQGCERVLTKTSSTDFLLLEGYYMLYADKMKAQAGSIELWIDPEKREASLLFD